MIKVKQIGLTTKDKKGKVHLVILGGGNLLTKCCAIFVDVDDLAKIKEAKLFSFENIQI